MRLKCKLSRRVAELDSVTSVWEGANWYERETFDLFGVHFRNHPNLTRIMMPDTGKATRCARISPFTATGTPTGEETT